MSAVWKNQIQSLLFHTVGWIYWLYQCSFVACVCKKLCWWHGSRRLTLCKELPARTTAAEVICCLDTHFASKSIDWKNRASVCTDVAASMTGIQHGVAKQFLKRARQAKWTHYFLHRENLAARQMSPEVMKLCLSLSRLWTMWRKKDCSQDVVLTCETGSIQITCSSCTTVRLVGSWKNAFLIVPLSLNWDVKFTCFFSISVQLLLNIALLLCLTGIPFRCVWTVESIQHVNAR